MEIRAKHILCGAIGLLRSGMAGMLCTCLALAGCSLDDERDACCEGAIMTYSYRPYEVEAFGDYIHSLRHYLFDAAGTYLGEIPPGQELTRQPLRLDAGSYTMVTLGNASEQTVCGFAPDEGLENFKLAVRQRFEQQQDILCNGDQLYWGVKEFTVESGPGGSIREGHGNAARASGTGRLVTYMNNIHCHLEVKVVWHNVPQDFGEYVMELKEVPAGYSLCPEHCSTVEGFIIPRSEGEPRKHRLRVPMLSQELYGEFVTLRYTNDHIPVFRLWFGDEAVTGDIDLSRAFREWGWYPSRTHVQKYRILLKLFGDGSVEVSPWVEASIEDWVSGGTFS